MLHLLWFFIDMEKFALTDIHDLVLFYFNECINVFVAQSFIKIIVACQIVHLMFVSILAAENDKMKSFVTYAK